MSHSRPKRARNASWNHAASHVRQGREANNNQGLRDFGRDRSKPVVPPYKQEVTGPIPGTAHHGKPCKGGVFVFGSGDDGGAGQHYGQHSAR